MNYNEVSVMICDDSILARKQLEDFLRELGVTELSEAVDGIQAVELYKQVHPTMVFMDIVMPNKDGVTAVKEIVDFDKDAKIVMTSSVGTKSYLKNAITAGACDFLQKPLEKDQIIRVVDKVIRGE